MTSHYILKSGCNGHTWIERPSGLCRICGPYSYYDQTGEVVKELNVLVDRINHLEEALRSIVNQDYRNQQRIKRLEEAGDAMEWWCADSESARNWRKAKEAKP